MRLTAETKVRRALQDILDAGLSAALRTQPRVGARMLSAKAIHELSKDLAGRMVVNPTVLEAFGEIAVKKDKEWLSTEDAAKMAGFSRPFIIALLDGPTYTGTVNRSDKGHRRVLASEFKQWLVEFSKIDRAGFPKTVADVRTGYRPEPEGTPPTTKEERARTASRKRALIAAQELGLA